jgi:hypothetical protein
MTKIRSLRPFWLLINTQIEGRLSGANRKTFAQSVLYRF